MRCANCKIDITNAKEAGESAIYSPDQAFDLCGDCFHEEDRLLKRRSTNEWPERLAHYRSAE